MGFLDSLLGRTQVPKSREDRIFAMSTAAISLEASAGLKPSGRSGVVFKDLPPGRFDELMADIKQLLQLQGADSGLKAEDHKDDLGFEWLILTGGQPDYEDALAAIHSVADSMAQDGLGDLLLAAAFRFDQSGQPVYWIYNYKQANFYPFVPTGPRRRDNSAELRLAALAKDELPVEPTLERWYALWGIPV